MEDLAYYNLASQEEVESLLDLALSSKVEDSTYALDENSVDTLSTE